MKIHDVPRDLVPDLWDAAKPYLASGLEYHPFLNCEGLLQLLLAGLAELVIGLDEGRIVGAGVVECVHYPSGQVVGNVVTMGSESGFTVKYLEAAFDHLEAWCRTHGCDTMGLIGRRGWSRFVKRRGWQVQLGLSAWRKIHVPRPPASAVPIHFGTERRSLQS